MRVCGVVSGRRYYLRTEEASAGLLRGTPTQDAGAGLRCGLFEKVNAGIEATSHTTGEHLLRYLKELLSCVFYLSQRGLVFTLCR